MFGLRGYVSELLFTVTTLLVDRSLGNLGLRRNKFLLVASNSNSGIRAGYVRSMLVWLERIVLVWALIILLLPSNVYLLILWHSWIETACDRPYAYSYARLVPQLTYGLYRASG
jgi:hypothetical protein